MRYARTPTVLTPVTLEVTFNRADSMVMFHEPIASATLPDGTRVEVALARGKVLTTIRPPGNCGSRTYSLTAQALGTAVAEAEGLGPSDDVEDES